MNLAKLAPRHLTYNQLKLQFKRAGVSSMHMLYCRKIFATYLRLEGIEQEIMIFSKDVYHVMYLFAIILDQASQGKTRRLEMR
jgi:hypothetical protein